MKRNIKALLLVVLAMVLVLSLVACGHEHSFSTEWTFNETSHWQAATCNHEEKRFEGEHQFGSGTESADGTAIEYKCRVCKYVKSEEIPPHVCTFEGEWIVSTPATIFAAGEEYRECTDTECNLRETRTIAQVEVVSISVTTQPTKLYYQAGESFDATGIKVVATGADNSTTDITTLVSYDKTTLAVADTAVAVSYQGKTATIAITVHQHSYADNWQTRSLPTVLAEGVEYRVCQGGNGCTEEETRTTNKVAVASIAITTLPKKTAYVAGTTFDPAGIKVVATGTNDTTADVTALVTYDKTTLVVGDTTVTVSYEGKTAVVEIVVEEVSSAILSVTEALSAVENGTLICVEGLFVGVSDVGHGYQREVLIKDVANDNLIAIQGMPDSYGTWPNVGYDKGDKVRLYATLVENKYVYSPTDEANNETHNKKYLQFADVNPANILDTVVSKDNVVSYSLDGMTVLEEWSDWQAFFKADTIKMYSYFTIKGEVCLNRFRAQDSNGNVTLYRPHMVYTGVSGANDIKPDGTRAVGFRENALVANIGSAWDNYFSGSTWENNAGPSMKQKKNVEIVCVLTGMNRYNYQVTVLEAKWLKTEPVYLEISTNQDIVMEMAEAYLRQGGQLEYDQYSSRRMAFATPEEATAQELGRFDCSSYVTSVYSNAFSIDAIPSEYFQNTKNYTAYAKQFEGDPNHADVVGYWEAMDYTTKEEQQAMLDHLRSLLQPGDILVYRHGTASWTPGYSEDDLRGHAILYMGNDQFSHSRGTDWNAGNSPDSSSAGIRNYNDPTKAQDRANDSEYTLGTVQYLDDSEVLNIGTGTRMLFGERSDRIFNFSIIRPLARTVETPTLTEQMAKRLTVAGLSFEKLTSAGINSGVTRGQEITYTLEITNHYDNEHKNIAFNEVLPEGVSFVSSNFGAVANGRNVTGTFNVDGKEVITLRWTVKVDNTAPAGALLCNVTTINGLLMKDITNSVVGYTQEQLQAVATKAREYATSGAKFSDPMDLARAIYKEALGVELFGTETADSTLESLCKLYDPTNPAVKSYALNTESQYATMVAPNMYGGWHFYYSAGVNEYIDNINLIRSPREHNFTLGDVIVAEWPTSKPGASTETTETRVYIYVGNGELVAIDSVTDTCTLEQNGSEEWVKSGSTWYQKHLLITLFAYQRFAVLRPGQVA